MDMQVGHAGGGVACCLDAVTGDAQGLLGGVRHNQGELDGLLGRGLDLSPLSRR